ncbi:unnamed protein product [Urochloa humidicola]
MKIGESPTKGEGSGVSIVERVMATPGAVEIPQLTRANYHEWALVMQVSMEALELWDAVEATCKERAKDRRVLATIIRGVPKEMKAGLAQKKSAKEAWDAVEKSCAGDDRMKGASIQRLMKQFEAMAFRDGESVADFAMRINGLITSLRELGEEMPDSRVVKKMLRVVPKKLKQVAVAVEMFGNLDTMAVEELVGRLQVAEDADAEEQEATNGGQTGQLLLTEEQWEARRRQRGKERVHGGGARRGGGEKGDGHGGERDEDDDDGGSSTSSGRGRSRYRGRCFDCGVRGHMAKDCPRKKKERALLADVDEEPTLL